MTASNPRQQRTHSHADAPEGKGAPSESEMVLVALSPEVLEKARERLLERYQAALCETHRTGGGAIADLFADLVALQKTRPVL